MRIRNLVTWRCALSLLAAAIDSGHGQTYPTKPIRIIAPGIGGGSDISARIIAKGLSGSFGQQVVVDNRASGVLPGELVSNAPPDGYTLLHAANTHWLLPFFQRKMPYNAVRDFTPIIWAVSSPNLLVVHPSVAAVSVQQLINLARARPGELNYASTGTGGSTHLAAELFNSMAGVKIVRVNFKGSGPALNSLIAGEVQMMFSSTLSAMAHVRTGRLRALAITSAKPSALAPGIPTIASSGLPGYQCVAMYGLFAPAKTPVSIVAKLNQAIAKVIMNTEVKEMYLKIGADVIASTSSEFATAIKLDLARMGKIIKDSGIHAE